MFSFFFKDFIYLFLDRGEGKERGRETSMCGCLSCIPNWGPDYLDWESNQRPFASQAGAQSTEPHRLGQGCKTHFHWGPHQPPGCLQRAEYNFRTV